MDELSHLAEHLKQNAIVLGMGNTLCSDDGAGSILATRLQGRIPVKVWDVATGLENYLGKIIKEKPQNIVIIDAADFGGLPGEFRVIEGEGLNTTNLFSTHNASISLAINYLKSNIKVDIIILAIQPKSIAFGDKISPEVDAALNKLEDWFCGKG